MSSNADSPSSAPARIRMRWLFYTAVGCFLLGVVCILIAVVVPLASDGQGALWAYLAAMVFAPLGFLLGIVYAVLSGRPPKNKV